MNFTEKFKLEYVNQLKSAEYLKVNPHYESEEVRKAVVEKMLNAIKTTVHNADWLKYNDAMRKAARKCGLRSSRELRIIIRGY